MTEKIIMIGVTERELDLIGKAIDMENHWLINRNLIKPLESKIQKAQCEFEENK